MDTAVFKIAGAGGLMPFGLNDRTVPGESVYLLSDPSGVSGHFSTDVINQFYWDGCNTAGDTMAMDDVRSLRVNVSTDCTPGSSSGAVLDDRGNVIGHVSKILPITGPL